MSAEKAADGVDGHEEVMARARAYVVERHAEAEMRRRTVAEMTRRCGLVVSVDAQRMREHVTIPPGYSLHEGNTCDGSIVVVDDEFASLVYDFATSARRQRRTDELIAGIVGSGKGAAAWWGVPEKSGIDLRDEKLFRARSGFVSGGGIADRSIPIVWQLPQGPQRSRLWLCFWYPWASLRGWWDGWRARRRFR